MNIEKCINILHKKVSITSFRTQHSAITFCVLSKGRQNIRVVFFQVHKYCKIKRYFISIYAIYLIINSYIILKFLNNNLFFQFYDYH